MKIIIVVTVCLIATMWSLALANKYVVENPIEKIKIVEVEVNDVYFDNVKVNGHCALTVPPCWEDMKKKVLRFED